MHRLIGFIVIFAVFLTFIVANLDNKSDVSLWWFKILEDVPVYLSVFISFACGMVFAFFIALYNRKKPAQVPGETTAGKLRKKSKKNESDVVQPDRVQGQDGSYGID